MDQELKHEHADEIPSMTIEAVEHSNFAEEEEDVGDIDDLDDDYVDMNDFVDDNLVDDDDAAMAARLRLPRQHRG
eukprot:TRINITY_DN456_c0_g1_i1.p2 TRINITY_DN456_c0_g1~~TRINITY_DN456_c0_g1_i1.p2  ORF type:complete len:75 (+),score=24.02 TRINITY_DN456_c0_g1_i1:225-449(+)